MSCTYKIKEASASFTSTEKKIAEYILNNKEEAVLESAQVLAEKSDTSPAAWIRFAKRLGYQGLTALKVDLAKDEDESDDLYNVLIDQNDSIESMIKKAQQISMRITTQTYKLLNVQILKKAIQTLLDSHNIYLFGLGGSSIVCKDFMHKLSRINCSVIYHEDPHVLLARVAHIQSNDVLIAVSYSGETDFVNTAVRYAKKLQAPVIAITQYNVKSTLAKQADICLYTPVEEKELRLGSISSRNAALVLTDLLYYGVAKENIEKTKEYLVSTRELVNEVDKK